MNCQLRGKKVRRRDSAMVVGREREELKKTILYLVWCGCGGDDEEKEDEEGEGGNVGQDRLSLHP